jgi:hypothetical protein
LLIATLKGCPTNSKTLFTSPFDGGGKVRVKNEKQMLRRAK